MAFYSFFFGFLVFQGAQDGEPGCKMLLDEFSTLFFYTMLSILYIFLVHFEGFSGGSTDNPRNS